MTDSGHADDPSQLCRNCGAVRAARYCGECGQRALDPDERRLGHLVRDAIGALTNLDSRAWRTLIALLFRPGRLTRDYIDGRRAHWLAPFTIFILANIVFFVSPALTDFSLPFEDQVPGRLAIQAYDDPQSLNPAFRTYLERGELVSFLEDFLPPFPGFFLYFPQRRNMAPKLRALIEYVKDWKGPPRS